MAGFPPPSLRPLVQEVASLLKESKQTVSVAETAAGGIISATLLSVPGASAYFAGGLTLYTLESRIAFGGWTKESVKEYKGPTPDVVAGLATHVHERLGSTFTLCESGTAGPRNPTSAGTLAKNRTPGYVALAIASNRGVVTREVETGTDDRADNMVAFAEASLVFLKEVLKGDVDFQTGKL